MFCPLSFQTQQKQKEAHASEREIESLIIKNNDDTEKNVFVREREKKEKKQQHNYEETTKNI